MKSFRRACGPVLRIVGWALLASLAPLDTAFAEEDFVERIPNGENPALNGGRPCVVCHIRPQGDGDRNDFGFDFENASGFFVWPRIYALDSDGDGQTNGVELGDPEGVWRPGETPARTEDLSLPADPQSLSFQPKPDVGPVDGGTPFPSPDAGLSAADAGQSEALDSGCRCVTQRFEGDAGRLLGALCALAVFVRSRRRPSARRLS